ncbi:hypothetical protein PARMER_03323 [Parabacteroides merdae ATCC 43184]|nr:hypothetical protein PARMER_03323 [Parabacteroides merdae ATCC 43184]
MPAFPGFPRFAPLLPLLPHRSATFRRDDGGGCIFVM